MHSVRNLVVSVKMLGGTMIVSAQAQGNSALTQITCASNGLTTGSALVNRIGRKQSRTGIFGDQNETGTSTTITLLVSRFPKLLVRPARSRPHVEIDHDLSKSCT